MSSASLRFTAIVQLLATCPLLAMSDTASNALGLSAAILILVPLCTALLSFIRGRLNDDTALAASMLALATGTACMQLLLSAWLPNLARSLGIFLPLIVSNLVLVAHLQTPHESPGQALLDGVRLSAGISMTLLPLGVARELVGHGSLLHDASSMLGAWARALELSVFPVELGFLLAMLPPGAFMALGLLLAARNWLTQRRP